MPIASDVYRKIVDAKVFIDEHFDSPIDLDAIAGERIDHARRMLAVEDCTVGEVCIQVGFESIGSFSLLFKKEIGVAPEEYREALKVRRMKAEEQPRRVIPFCFIAEITGEKKQ